MFLISAIRMTGYTNRPGLTDHTRSYFWMYLESCVAVIMASISALDPLFFKKKIIRVRVEKGR